MSVIWLLIFIHMNHAAGEYATVCTHGEPRRRSRRQRRIKRERGNGGDAREHNNMCNSQKWGEIEICNKCSNITQISTITTGGFLSKHTATRSVQRQQPHSTSYDFDSCTHCKSADIEREIARSVSVYSSSSLFCASRRFSFRCTWISILLRWRAHTLAHVKIEKKPASQATGEWESS